MVILRRSEAGNSIVEYTIIIAFLILATFAVTRAMGTSVSDGLRMMSNFLLTGESNK